MRVATGSTATYRDAVRSLAPDLWVVDRPLPLAVGDIGARMTVIRLHDGGLFLHSPVRLDDELRRGLDAVGPGGRARLAEAFAFL